MEIIDFEREHIKDEMYIQEKQKQMEEDWWRWECEQKEKQQQLPAIIEIIHLPKLKLKNK